MNVLLLLLSSLSVLPSPTSGDLLPAPDKLFNNTGAGSLKQFLAEKRKKR